jgi:class 3 adenylate cyclase
MDGLGTHVTLRLEIARQPFVSCVLVLGDTALFGNVLWMFPLVYELWKLVAKSMDRGIKKEQRKIRLYCIYLHGFLFFYLLVQSILTMIKIDYRGYDRASRGCLLFVYVILTIGVFYMIGTLIQLHFLGRKYESIHGQFVLSPVYVRLQRIMIVYAAFTLQFILSSIILAILDYDEKFLLQYVGFSLILFNSTGLCLSIVTGCSLECILTTCRSCIPDEIEHEYGMTSAAAMMHGGGGMMIEIYPPLEDPVFVFTDIESSSALWGVGNGEIMHKATEIHDNLLRSLLQKYRGYEITTCGDAFQLAFHTIPEAVDYCFEVQKKLLEAKWPKQLHGLVPATKKEKYQFKRIFHGLRVRMGIHDANKTEGNLVSYIHPVTRRRTYTGASEVIANEVGDLGSGGEILITRRVADWLQENYDEIREEYEIENIGEYEIGLLGLSVDVYQLNLKKLIGRKKFFTPLLDLSLNPNVVTIGDGEQHQMEETTPEANHGTDISIITPVSRTSGGSRSSVTFHIAHTPRRRHSIAAKISRQNLQGAVVNSTTSPNFQPAVHMAVYHDQIIAHTV